MFRRLSDDQFLWLTRAVVVAFACMVTVYSLSSNETIHGMVENAYKVTLVTAFVPLVFGIYWRRATTQGALAAIVCGVGTWLALEFLNPEGFWPPQFAGLIAATAGMVFGSLAPQVYGTRRPEPVAVH
jgi:Na+/proline symporter